MSRIAEPTAGPLQFRNDRDTGLLDPRSVCSRLGRRNTGSALGYFNALVLYVQPCDDVSDILHFVSNGWLQMSRTLHPSSCHAEWKYERSFQKMTTNTLRREHAPFGHFPFWDEILETCMAVESDPKVAFTMLCFDALGHLGLPTSPPCHIFRNRQDKWVSIDSRL